MGQLQGLQARPQVAEGEGGDVTDVVVSQGQLTEAPGQIRGDGGELVGGQVQSFQRPERKCKGCRKSRAQSGTETAGERTFTALTGTIYGTIDGGGPTKEVPKCLVSKKKNN